MKYKELEKLVYDYPTKYKEGFLPEEIEAIKENFTDLDVDKFDLAMRGSTCTMKEEKFVMYHCDVLTALSCGIEGRDMYLSEWD